MRLNQWITSASFLAIGFLASTPALAQQTTGTPGSSNATTTIDGRYLPPPDQSFKGEINLNAAQSKPAWPARVVPPKGAPNILLIMTDDVGFGAPSTFGGVIPTPALDRIAANGLRYCNFHSTALCSPTRAALITGRNHHSVGFGVISEQSTGFPGYNSIIPKDSATIGHILLENGYRTSWFGKDHNTPTYTASQAGPFDQWPTGMGFEYQALAEPGTVLVTSRVQHQVAGLFVAEERGSHALKGIPEPAVLFRLVRASGGGARSGARQLTPLVGRDDEIAMLTRR